MRTHIFNIKIEEPPDNSLDQQFNKFEKLFDIQTDKIEDETKVKK
jgi:hypothetical protein